MSPFLVLGLALRPLPPGPLSRAARPLLDTLAQRLTPRLADRLDGITGRIAVLPTDLPFGLEVAVTPEGLGLELIATDAPPPTEATVRAPAQLLLDLAMGTGVDGDGSFFGRALAMEGDTGLCMAFRTALEEAELDADDIADLLAPLPRSLTQHLLRLLGRLHGRVSRDLDDLQRAVVDPVATRQQRLERRLAAVEAELAALARTSRRRAAGDVHAA